MGKRNDTHCLCGEPLNQSIHTIESRRLITLGQRRIIENRVDEIIDRAAESHHRLPDVDQFARALADDMHAQQLVILAMKRPA